ncbi:hypothetical protein RO07_02225 [Pandoraea pulmonicola]|nr:hypothetical protein RO07_02225 [Pandoraea pulmonicola]
MPPSAKKTRQETGAAGGSVPITDVMVQTWSTIGRAWIEACSRGLDSLARWEVAPAGTSRSHLYAERDRSEPGEDRLHPDGKVQITDTMLQIWAALGPGWLETTGGLDGLARRHNVPAEALKSYLHADASLTQLGRDRLNPSGKVKITDALLQTWAALGPVWIEAAGGLDGLARRHHVALVALKNYLRADGSLTQRGQERLEAGGKAKVTDAMLRRWSTCGLEGIERAGGLGGVARLENVPLASLRRYLYADGSLTLHGEDRLNTGGKAKITDALLQEWKDLGQAGIKAAGGLDGVARRHNVHVGALKHYLRTDGTLSQTGEDRLNPSGKAKITSAMLRMWKSRGQAGVGAEGGLDGLARLHNVPAGALKNYLRADGSLTPRGEHRLNPRRTAKISGAMLREWATLGLGGIEAAGGLDGVARRHNVPAGVLRRYLRADGSLTQRGEERLNWRKKAEITDAMLQRWKTLGKAGIEEAGGYLALARQANVRPGALRNYLRTDGRLTQRGEDRLNPDGNAKITDAMLQAWAALGEARIKAEGGLDGVARRANVAAVALKNYLRADGSLTPIGEKRLRKADAQPTDAR